MEARAAQICSLLEAADLLLPEESSGPLSLTEGPPEREPPLSACSSPPPSEELDSLSEDDLPPPEQEPEDRFEDAVSDAGSASPPLPNVWAKHPKHIFVISEAGKPIYSLHGEEDHLVSLGGIMQALVSVVADSCDAIRLIRAGKTTIVFLAKPPLILVAVSSTGQSDTQLTTQLNYIYNQILSILTGTQLNKIFSQRRNYDLRRMLSGSERLMTHLSNAMDKDPCFFLSAVRCLPLSASVRDTVSESIIRFAGKVQDVVFGILIADNQLVTLVRMKKYYIHPADLHLIFNLINSSESFKHSESWSPICLPKFDSGGFLHAHVSYLTDNCPACLLLLTLDRNAFFDLSTARAKIVERMERHGSIAAIEAAIKGSSYSTRSIELPEMRHFLYKSRTSAQFTSPEYAVCYKSLEERDRLCRVYLAMQNRFHSVHRPLKLLHLATSHEVVLGWLTQAFELYAVFSPLQSKLSVITAVNKLLRWVKKEEERLFILTAPTF